MKKKQRRSLFSIVYTDSEHRTYVSLAAIKCLYHFVVGEEGRILFPFALLSTYTTHSHTHTLSFSHDLGLTRKWMVWANELRCLKSSMQKYCFWHSNVVFLLGFLFICCVAVVFVIFHSFFLLSSSFFFQCFVGYIPCVRVLRLYFFLVALIEVKRYLFSGLTQEKKKKTLFLLVYIYI